jgi:hypothetical protein
LEALRPFGFNAFLDRASAGLLPALERFFIASTRTLTKGIVAVQDSNGHGCLNSATCIRAGAAQPCQGVAVVLLRSEVYPDGKRFQQPSWGVSRSL